jgi:hypothetical protein
VESTTAQLRKYASRTMETVQGYLTSLDARIIAALLSYQGERNLRGHLCEIGAHHGRLFLMLALARRPAERALAIDLFEDDAINTNTRHAGRDKALFANARRLGIKLSDEEVFKTSSLDVEQSDILWRTGGLIRFFSIDGCHLHKYVEHDLGLAEQTLTTQGIIAVDDFFNIDWPDVTLATFDFLRRMDAFTPFAITSKLYLAPRAAAESYKNFLLDGSRAEEISSVEILGQQVLAPRESTLRKGYNLLRGLVRRNDFWPARRLHL